MESGSQSLASLPISSIFSLGWYFYQWCIQAFPICDVLGWFCFQLLRSDSSSVSVWSMMVSFSLRSRKFTKAFQDHGNSSWDTRFRGLHWGEEGFTSFDSGNSICSVCSIPIPVFNLHYLPFSLLKVSFVTVHMAVFKSLKIQLFTAPFETPVL